MPEGSEDQPQETEEDRARYRELLEELRTVVPGVQVLFAFLLTGAFSQRFTELDTLGRRTFAAVLIGTALTAIVLMAPGAVHRHSPPGERARRVAISVRLQVAGMFMLLATMSLAVFVVARFISGNDTAIGVAFGATVAVVGLVLWYAIPILKHR